MLDVGAIPKGVAFDAPGGATGTAYVLNTLGNSCEQVAVDVRRRSSPGRDRTVGNDPTPAAVRRGAIAFNNAFASTTRQPLVRQLPPRRQHRPAAVAHRRRRARDRLRRAATSRARTMPVRGLKNTLPLHWDGTLGDPFGGGNGSVGLAGTGGTAARSATPTATTTASSTSSQASLDGVMCDQSGACPNTAAHRPQQQDDMATFLASVSYPPARSRRIDDTLSDDSRPGRT